MLKVIHDPFNDTYITPCTWLKEWFEPLKRFDRHMAERSERRSELDAEIHAILQEHGCWMSAEEIAEELEQRGINW